MAVPQSFPAKIYQILENESGDIIRWNNDGCSFRIVDHGRFEREIVPKYFRHNQISSVQRQLNLYGFKCISRGELRRSFFHPRFKRGEWEIVKKLTRYIPPKKSSPFSETSNYPYDGNNISLPQLQRPSDISLSNPNPNPSGSMPPLQQSYPTGVGSLGSIKFSAGIPQHLQQSFEPVECANLSVPAASSSMDSTPRDSKPSELALRLGYRLANNIMNDTASVSSTASSTSYPPLEHHNHEHHSLHHQNSSQSHVTAQQHNDFELMREFDFFDNFADFDFPCDQTTTASAVHKHCAPSPPTVAAVAPSALPMIPDGPLTCKPLLVLPIPAAPSASQQQVPAAAKSTCDACCMTDLVFSEIHGGFIYQ